MVSLDTKAVDVVNVTVAEAVADAAVVMLKAVAAADTQPTHGVFTRAAIVSLFVLISTPPGPDASEAASGCVIRPLHVTVTAPAGAAPDKVIVTALVKNPDVHTTAGDITPHANVPEAVMRLGGKVSVMVSLDTKAVDVVNVTVAEAVADAAVVMLKAVAAADTQPTQGQDTCVATESTDV